MYADTKYTSGDKWNSKKDIYLLAEISFDKFISSQLAMHSLMKWTHAILCLCISLMKSVSEQSYTPLVYSLNRLQEVQNTSSPQIKGFRSAPLLTNPVCEKWCGSETLDLESWEHINIVTYCLSECAILLPHNIAAHEFETNWGAKVLKRFNPCVYKILKYILQMLALQLLAIW